MYKRNLITRENQSYNFAFAKKIDTKARQVIDKAT